MARSLEGQIALVTGASRGIGAAIARECAAAGARVVLTARSEEALTQTAQAVQSAGSEALVVPADVTSADDVDRLLSRAETELGPVDLLVNNAGRLGALGPTWECDVENWWQDATVNVRGVFLCCWKVLPGMIERGGGRIVNMVGGGTRGPFPFASAYATSKAAVMRFTETLAQELAEIEANVRVFGLSPGFVRTAMTEQFRERPAGQRWMQQLVERLDEGEDIPPQRAGAMVVQLGSGRLDALHGRYLHSGHDADRLDEIVAEAREIVSDDRRALRMQ